MKPPLRRAIIRAIPDYNSWPEIERERYRLNLPQKQDFLIRRALLSSLLGIEVSTAAQLDDVMKGFDDECYLLLNSTLLPFQGVSAKPDPQALALARSDPIEPPIPFGVPTKTPKKRPVGLVKAINLSTHHQETCGPGQRWLGLFRAWGVNVSLVGTELVTKKATR